MHRRDTTDAVWDATLKAMQEIGGAVVGITLVLIAVFIPMAFASGSVGVIYRQFSLSMAVAILFSAFLALSLTPALCARLLRPTNGESLAKQWVVRARFFSWFNGGYQRLVAANTGAGIKVPDVATLVDKLKNEAKVI